MWRRYIALGDSFSEGLVDVVGPDGRHVGWADRVAASLNQVQPGVEYANLAVRGKLLSQVAAEQVPAACEMRPDLVTLAAGINDALRRSWDLHVSATALENATGALTASGADVVLFAFGDPRRRSRVMGTVAERIAATNAATRSIAQRYGCRVVDFWGCAVFDDDIFWDEDRLHLSPAGHVLAARATLAALGLASQAWRTPLAPGSWPGRHQVLTGHARWIGGHFVPWVGRRVRGRSSGDGLHPKRTTWGPAPSDAYAVDAL
jgi:lysophospholipase L1-like esterase